MTVERWLLTARKAVVAMAAGMGLLEGASAMAAEQVGPSAPKSFWVYAGSYTNGKTPSEGIYKFELDVATGKLTPHGVAAKLTNPAFLAVHPSGKFLYAVNEVEKIDGRAGGA